MTAALTLSGVTLTHGDGDETVTALDAVDLEVRRGELVAVVGPSGSGKSSLLAEVGMEHKLDRRPHQLSGGERQRVGIARALVTGPELLLVDEPTAALDRQRSQDIVGLLAREARERDVATLMVTHDHDVLSHCDRVHEMVDGRLAPLGA